MSLGTKLRQARNATGLSIDRVAGLSGVTPRYIGQIERGEITNVGIETLEKITNALNASIADLLPPKKSHKQKRSCGSILEEAQ